MTHTWFRVIKNTLSQAITYGARAISNFVMIVLIAQLAGAESLGVYSFAITFTAIATFFRDFGIGLLLIREISKSPHKSTKYINNALSLTAILGPIVFIVLIIAINLANVSPIKIQAVYLCAAALMLFSFTTLFKSAFYAHERMELETSTIVIQEGIFLLGGVVVLISSLPLIFLFAAYALSRLVGLVFSYFVYRHVIGPVRLELDIDFCKKLIVAALPFVISMVLNLLYARSAILLLAYFEDDKSVGYYEAAYNLSLRLAFLAMIVNTSMLPILSRSFKESKKQFLHYSAQSRRYALALGIPLVISLFLSATKLVPLIYGSLFEPTILLFQITIFALGFKFIGHAYATALTAGNHQASRAKAAGIAAFVNLSINLILIPMLGRVGAAIAATTTEFILFLSLMYYAHKYLEMKFEKNFVWKPLLASVPMIIFIFMLQDISVIILLPSGILIYLAAFFILKGFSNQELKLMRQAVAKFIVARSS
ncbi:MAG: hypothetical protein CSA11_04465 [Chloroflexi bacterium]|nr:MAG: hypothetical protein CSA11_04465 [Chloroflexota bacterium]